MKSAGKLISFTTFLILVSGAAWLAGAQQSVVAYWPFDTLFSGDTFKDYSGNGYNAVVAGSGVGVTTGISGNAVSCTGTAFNITVANSSTAFALNHFTLEGWFWADSIYSTSGTQAKFLDYSYTSSGVRNGFGMYLTGGYPTLTKASGDGSTWDNATSGTMLTAKKWFYIVGTYDSTTLRLYVNGVQQASAAGQGKMVSTGANAHIGCQQTAAGVVGSFFYGNIDELKLYNYALTADSILAHYQFYTQVLTLVSPSNGAINQPLAPALSWSSVGGATSYTLQVATVSDFSSTVISQTGLSVISSTINGLANSTTYYWRGNASSGLNAGAWSAAWSFTTLSAIPPATPVLVSPANGAVNVPVSTTLAWNTLATASMYQVQLTTDASFQTGIIQDSGIITGSQSVSGLAATTQYFWRVRALNAYGAGSWASAYFTTGILPPASPALSAPTNGSINLATAITLSWSTVAAATNYLVQVSTGNTFANYFLQDSSLTSGSRAVTGLALNTSYYWEVRASNAGGPSGWAGTWSFTTLPPLPVAPTLSLPSNNAASQTIYQTLSWNTVNVASTYTVQVATVSTFSTTVTTQSGLTGTTQGVGPFAFNTQYFWEANATNPTGTGPWSTSWSFTTITGIPVLSSPSTGSKNEPNSLQLSWGPVTGAASYGLQVSTTSAFSSTVFGSSGLTGDTSTVAGLGNNTVFYWRANSGNPGGGQSSWSGAWSFITLLSAPLLSQPANAATGVSISPTLSWTTMPNVSSYRLQAATDSLFTSIVKDSTFAAGSCSLSNLSNISLYYWHILATGIGGTSPWSSTWNFTTIYYPPPVPTLSLPGTGSSNQPTSLTLSWSSGGNASTWSLQLSTSSSFASLFIQDSLLASTMQPVSGLANYTTYFWRVDAGNSPGGRSSWTGAWSFETTPATPVLVLPSNDAVGQPTTVTLDWGSVAGESSYSLEVSTDITFSSAVTSVNGITANTASVTGLANSTAYYWQVNTLVPGGISAWSGVWSFWTIFAPPMPALPANGAIGQLISPVLSWGAVTGATSYSLQVSTATGFSTTCFSQSGLTSVSAAPGGLGYFTVYYWRVNAANAGGSSLWSGVWSFTTAAHLVVPISSGWFIYSLNMHPADSSTNGVFGVLKGFILAMDGSDNLYWPGASLDEIGTIHTGLGYWVLDTIADDTLKLTGPSVNISTTPVPLPAANWNLVSYLPQVSMPIATALAPINSQLVLAMDGSSNFYWPAASLNEIGTMIVGNGYFIVTNAAASLTYPTAGSSPAKEFSATASLAKLANPPAPKHFAKHALTGNFAAFLAPHVELGGKLAADHCEVGAFDTKGNLVGSGTVINGLTAFALCGKDPAGKIKNGCLPSEKLTFKLWNGSIEYPLMVTRGSNPVYSARTILSATLAVPAGALISSFNLARAYPNPFKGTANIAFDVPTVGGVAQHAIEINIYDMKGALVKQLIKGVYQAGHYELAWNCGESRDGAVGSSVYLVRMRAQGFDKQIKLVRLGN